MQIPCLKFCCFLLLGGRNLFCAASLSFGHWIAEGDLDLFSVSKSKIQKSRDDTSLYKDYHDCGNVLFTQEDPARVYLSGNFPYLTVENDKICQYRTMVHIILDEPQARELILAYRLFYYMKWKEQIYYNVMKTQFLCKISENSLLNVNFRDIRASFDAYSRQFETVKDGLKIAIEKALKQYIKGKKMQDYIRQAGKNIELKFQNNFRYPIARPVGVDIEVFKQLTHTERMLIYDHRDSGEWPRDKMIIYSRLAMCETCEPEIVKASKRKNTLVIAEQNYAGSNLRNDPTSTVKKIIVPRVRPFL